MAIQNLVNPLLHNNHPFQSKGSFHFRKEDRVALVHLFLYRFSPFNFFYDFSSIRVALQDLVSVPQHPHNRTFIPSSFEAKIVSVS